MIAALKTLADVPGVRFVMLTSPDGVPIATPSGPDAVSEAGLGSEEALAALTAVWFSEITRHAGQLSWNEPRRAVLKAARGTLILQRLRNAVLLVLLARGTAPEHVRLAMDGTAARIDRSVRNMGRSEGPAATPRTAGAPSTQEPPSPLPTQSASDSDVEAPASQGRETEDPSGN